MILSFFYCFGLAPVYPPSSLKASYSHENGTIYVSWNTLPHNNVIWNFNVSENNCTYVIYPGLYDGTFDSVEKLTTTDSSVVLYNYANPYVLYSIHVKAFSVLHSESSETVCVMLPIAGNTFLIISGFHYSQILRVESQDKASEREKGRVGEGGDYTVMLPKNQLSNKLRLIRGDHCVKPPLVNIYFQIITFNSVMLSFILKMVYLYVLFDLIKMQINLQIFYI